MRERIPDCQFDEAFMWALDYNGWDDHFNAMVEYIESHVKTFDSGYEQVPFPRGESKCVTKEDVVGDQPNSILWMVLVMMFGEYGTSPRYGWIEHPRECVEYMRDLRERTWGTNHYHMEGAIFQEEDGHDRERFDAYCAERARKWEAE